MGRLRDLPERIAAADALVVSKCPWEMNPWEMDKWALSLGIERYNQKECFGWRCDNGRKQYLFFTKIGYDEALPVFPEGNSRYLYSKTAVMFSGIADDTPFSEQLRLSYKLVGHLKFDVLLILACRRIPHLTDYHHRKGLPKNPRLQKSSGLAQTKNVLYANPRPVPFRRRTLRFRGTD